jgi:hypothetical protein
MRGLLRARVVEAQSERKTRLGARLGCAQMVRFWVLGQFAIGADGVTLEPSSPRHAGF